MAEPSGRTDVPSRLREYAHGVVRSGANYLTNLLWLLRRSLAGGRVRLATLFVLGQLSVGAQVVAIGGLYLYATQMETDAVLSVGPLGAWRVREEPFLLWVAIAASAGAFAASAWFNYLAAKLAFVFGEEEISRGLTESVGWARRLPDARAQVASRLLAELQFKQIGGGCRYAGLTIALLYSAVSPVVGGIVAVGVMLSMDPALTLLIAIAMVLWSPAFYPLARRATAVAASKSPTVRAFNRQCRRLLASPSTPVPEPWDGARQVAGATLAKRRVSNQMTLLTGVGATLIGAVAAITLASRIISEQGEWPFFLAYLIVMRVAVSGCLVAPQTVAAVSRFYPQTATYVRFLKSVAEIDGTDLGSVAHGDAVTLGTLPDGEVVGTRAGQRVALVTAAECPAIQASLLEAGATGTGLPLNTAWLDGAGGPEVGGNHRLIALVEHGTLAAMQPVERESMLRDLHNAVAIIVHRHAAGVGAYGESLLVTSTGDRLTSSAPLGTAESRDLLAAFAAASAGSVRASAGAAGGVDADDEAEEMEG